MPHLAIDQRMRDCIDQCQECASVCLETVAHCLELGGSHAAAEHIAVLLDCASLCATSAEFMSRGSGMHPRVCDVCAEACERCAESCEQFADDELMRRCAEVCRRTAGSCREMAQAAV